MLVEPATEVDSDLCRKILPGMKDIKGTLKKQLSAARCTCIFWPL